MVVSLEKFNPMKFNPNILRILGAFPIIAIITVINVLIMSIVSVSIGYYLLSMGFSRDYSIGISIIAAVATHFYIIYNHRIRAFTNLGEKKT